MLSEAGPAESQLQKMVVWRSPLAAGGTCGQAQGSLGAPSGEAEAWRNPGRETTFLTCRSEVLPGKGALLISNASE